MLLFHAVNMFFQAIIYLILGRAIMSWFVRPGDRIYPLYTMLCRVTEPLLEPCRRLTYRMGMNRGIDISPIVALFGLYILNRIVIELLKVILL